MSHSTSIQLSFRSQLQAIGAVVRKELLQTFRYPGIKLQLLFWPFVFPAAYVWGAKALNGPQNQGLNTFTRLAGTANYGGYIVLGMALWMWMNSILWGTGQSLRQEQMQGTLESTWVCPVWRSSILIGSALSHLVLYMILLAAMMLGGAILWGMRFHGHPGLILLVLAASVLALYGVGLVFASLVVKFKEANAMVFLVRGLFMTFCGLSYPLAVLPGWARRVATFLPLTYAIESMRAVLLAGASFQEIRPLLGKLALFSLVLPLLGYLAFVHTERRARRTGSLGQY